jgi:16S rRNA pseudouridine516 synthase
MKLVRLLANLGYGSRKDTEKILRSGIVTDHNGSPFGPKDAADPQNVLLNGEPLDPLSPLVIIINKPTDYTCSTDDPGKTIYDLLPQRFSKRNPGLNSVGRLDKDTSGLLLITDDGKLLHRVIHPKSDCPKTYHAWLDRPLSGNEAETFSSGTMMLESETRPLLPAHLTQLNQNEALVTLHEGRYHQVRRMFAATGNHVTKLTRISIGELKLPQDLPEGEWRILSPQEISLILPTQSHLAQ